MASALKGRFSACERKEIYQPNIGEDLDILKQDQLIKSDPGDNKRRRTIVVHKGRGGSCGFTLQSYGLHHRKSQETELLTYVDYVEIGGPAHIAGLRPGDVILSINGTSVENTDHKTLVNFIKSSGNTLRMIVLFEDCCRKIQLRFRQIKLQQLLAEKICLYRELEEKEAQILGGSTSGSHLNLDNTSDDDDSSSLVSSINGSLLHLGSSSSSFLSPLRLHFNDPNSDPYATFHSCDSLSPSISSFDYDRDLENASFHSLRINRRRNNVPLVDAGGADGSGNWNYGYGMNGCVSAAAAVEFPNSGSSETFSPHHHAYEFSSLPRFFGRKKHSGNRQPVRSVSTAESTGDIPRLSSTPRRSETPRWNAVMENIGEGEVATEFSKPSVSRTVSSDKKNSVTASTPDLMRNHAGNYVTSSSKIPSDVPDPNDSSFSRNSRLRNSFRRRVSSDFRSGNTRQQRRMANHVATGCPEVIRSDPAIPQLVGLKRLCDDFRTSCLQQKLAERRKSINRLMTVKSPSDSSISVDIGNSVDDSVSGKFSPTQHLSPGVINSPKLSSSSNDERSDSNQNRAKKHFQVSSVNVSNKCSGRHSDNDENSFSSSVLNNNNNNVKQSPFPVNHTSSNCDYVDRQSSEKPDGNLENATADGSCLRWFVRLVGQELMLINERDEVTKL